MKTLRTKVTVAVVRTAREMARRFIPEDSDFRGAAGRVLDVGGLLVQGDPSVPPPRGDLGTDWQMIGHDIDRAMRSAEDRR